MSDFEPSVETRERIQGNDFIRLDNLPITLPVNLELADSWYPEDPDLRKSLLESMAGSNQVLAQAVVDVMNLCRNDRVDTALFLDRSARPLGVVLENAWPLVFKDREITVQYVNVGRESSDWQLPEVQSAIRGVFERDIVGKSVCIVDEFKETGTSLLRANRLFEQVFPDAGRFVYSYALGSQPHWNIADGKYLIGVRDPKEKSAENAFGYISEPDTLTDARDIQEREKFHRGLRELGEAIAEHAQRVTKSDVTIHKDIPELDSYQINHGMAKVFGFQPKDVM